MNKEIFLKTVAEDVCECKFTFQALSQGQVEKRCAFVSESRNTGIYFDGASMLCPVLPDFSHQTQNDQHIGHNMHSSVHNKRCLYK